MKEEKVYNTVKNIYKNPYKNPRMKTPIFPKQTEMIPLLPSRIIIFNRFINFYRARYMTRWSGALYNV